MSGVRRNIHTIHQSSAQATVVTEQPVIRSNVTATQSREKTAEDWRSDLARIESSRLDFISSFTDTVGDIFKEIREGKLNTAGQETQDLVEDLLCDLRGITKSLASFSETSFSKENLNKTYKNEGVFTQVWSHWFDALEKTLKDLEADLKKVNRNRLDIQAFRRSWSKGDQTIGGGKPSLKQRLLDDIQVIQSCLALHNSQDVADIQRNAESSARAFKQLSAKDRMQTIGLIDQLTIASGGAAMSMQENVPGTQNIEHIVTVNISGDGAGLMRM